MKSEIYLHQIKKEFPHLEWKKFRFLTNGWDHVIAVLDEKLIFRFPREVRYREKLRNEIQLLEFLKKRLSVGIPQYTFVSKDMSFAGYKMLNGQETRSTYYKQLTSSEKEAFTKQIANFLTRLHLTPDSVISKFNMSVDNPSRDFKRFADNTKKLLFPHLSKREITAIQGYLDELEITIDHSKYSNVLIHDDLAWKHILWDSQKVNIIDFSDHKFGDPARDFTGLWEYGQKFVNRVYELYKGKKG